jgi:AraC-like DNA-binding protein
MQIPQHESAPGLIGQSLRVLIWDHDLTNMWCLDEGGHRVPYLGRGSTWHYHADLELTLITAGAGILSVGDHIGRFEAPDCLLLGSDLPHVWKSEGAMTGVSLQFHAEQAGGLGSLPELGQLASLWRRASHGLRWSGVAAGALSDLIAPMSGQSALQRLSAFLRMMDIMQHAGTNDAEQLSVNILAPAGIDREGSAMDRVFDHIMDHYREDLLLEDLVAMSGASQATFCRRFLRHTGKTFIAYLNAIRIQEVRRALVESERSITDIAFSSGFNNLSHFHDLFRRTLQCTPRSYRLRHRPRR